jgi:formate hydrogenlyase transcriptional activator
MATSAGGVGIPPGERLAFERLLTDISANFVNSAGGDIADQIETALYRVLDALGFDRSTFGETDDEGRGYVICSAALGDAKPIPRGPAPRYLDWHVKQILSGELVVTRGMGELPPDAAEAAQAFQIEGLRSQLTIPLSVGGRVVGAIGFAGYREVPWDDDLVARLKLLGEVFAQALARKRQSEKLNIALTEVKLLKERLEKENRYLREEANVAAVTGLVTRSPRFNITLTEVAQVAPTGATVLLLGQTGSGKEVLAQAIHDASGRKQRQMIKINCAALPATLIEVELFGREKGAYTGAIARQPGRFELAHQSTILLDEIGEMPIELQSKLLRVLQDGAFERVGGTQTIKVDVRIIAATNRDLTVAIREGKFREDLYYRLNVFPIEVPSLRERREDIELLAWGFVKEFGKAMGKPIDRIADESIAAMAAYAWPGNIRELRNVIERAIILEQGRVLHVSLGRWAAASPAAVSSTPRTLEDAERAHILDALGKSAWRVRGADGAAARLDINPTTLESRMKKLGLQRPK